MDIEKERARRAAYQRQWRSNNPEKWNEIAKRGRKRWKANHRDEHREAQRVNRHRVRLEVLRLLGGGKCANCGFADWRALQIDHVDGYGFADSRTKQNPHFFRKWVLNHLDEAKKFYQVLCANCNWIKRHENDEHHYGDGDQAQPIVIAPALKGHFYTHNGETKTLRQWSDVTGIPLRSLQSRISENGWSVADALTQPIRRGLALKDRNKC